MNEGILNNKNLFLFDYLFFLSFRYQFWIGRKNIMANVISDLIAAFVIGSQIPVGQCDSLIRNWTQLSGWDDDMHGRMIKRISARTRDRGRFVDAFFKIRKTIFRISEPENPKY